MTARVIRLDDAVHRVTQWRNIVMIREPGKTRLFCVCALVGRLIRAWPAMPIPL